MGPFAVGDARLAALLARAEGRLERTGAEARWDTARSGARFVVPRRRARDPRSGGASAPGARGRGTVRHARPASPGSACRGAEDRDRGRGPRVRAAQRPRGRRARPRGCGSGPAACASQGRKVAFTVEAEGTPAELLRFRTEPLVTAYASRNVFVLTWARHGAARWRWCSRARATRDGRAGSGSTRRCSSSPTCRGAPTRGCGTCCSPATVPGPTTGTPRRGPSTCPGWPEGTARAGGGRACVSRA